MDSRKFNWSIAFVKNDFSKKHRTFNFQNTNPKTGFSSNRKVILLDTCKSLGHIVVSPEKKQMDQACNVLLQYPTAEVQLLHNAHQPQHPATRKTHNKSLTKSMKS